MFIFLADLKYIELFGLGFYTWILFADMLTRVLFLILENNVESMN